MNNLSWMLYAAETLGKLTITLNVLAGCATVALLFVTSFSAIAMIDGDPDFPSGAWKKPAKWLAVPFAVFLLTALLPSASTIYMIAASEAGETIVTSPDAMEMFNDVKSIIKQKLKRELGE